MITPVGDFTNSSIVEASSYLGEAHYDWTDALHHVGSEALTDLRQLTCRQRSVATILFTTRFLHTHTSWSVDALGCALDPSQTGP